MAAFTDAFENKLVDFLFRAQALGLANSTAGAGTGPSTWYFGLLTALPTDSTPGTEVSGGAYARVGVAAALANWAGTQGPTTTTASTGTTGTTSNNGVVTFPAPVGANWGVIVGMGLYDSSTGGMLCVYSALAASKTVNDGDAAPTFPISAFTCQVDN